MSNTITLTDEQMDASLDTVDATIYRKKLENVDAAIELLHEALTEIDASYEQEIRDIALSNDDDEDKQAEFCIAIMERLSGPEIAWLYSKIMDKIREGEL